MEMDDRTVVTLDALGSEDRIINDPIQNVTILGFDSEIKSIQKKDELVIEVPSGYSNQNPPCFKIELKDIPSDIFGD